MMTKGSKASDNRVYNVYQKISHAVGLLEEIVLGSDAFIKNRNTPERAFLHDLHIAIMHYEECKGLIINV